MKLYVIRHGESEGNQLGVFSGWHQHNLTEKGREDARTAGRIISKVKFDKVYSSDLKRAMQTASICAPDYEVETMAKAEISAMDEGQYRAVIKVDHAYI